MLDPLRRCLTPSEITTLLEWYIKIVLWPLETTGPSRGCVYIQQSTPLPLSLYHLWSGPQCLGGLQSVSAFGLRRYYIAYFSLPSTGAFRNRWYSWVAGETGKVWTSRFCRPAGNEEPNGGVSRCCVWGLSCFVYD